MLGELTARQVISLANEGLKPDAIAKELAVEEAEIRLCLAANSAGAVEDRDINDEQLAILRRRAYDLAIHAEDESIQAKMTMFLIERDRPKAKEVSSNIALINNAIIDARGRFAQLADSYSK